MRHAGDPEIFQAVDDDAAADPQHRCGAHFGQQAQRHRHGLDQAAPDAAQHPRPMFGQVQADVVHLYDQRHHAIDAHRDHQAHQRQGGGLDRQRPVGDVGQGDGHDLAGQDQVGADRPADLLFFKLG